MNDASLKQCAKLYSTAVGQGNEPSFISLAAQWVVGLIFSRLSKSVAEKSAWDARVSAYKAGRGNFVIFLIQLVDNTISFKSNESNILPLIHEALNLIYSAFESIMRGNFSIPTDALIELSPRTYWSLCEVEVRNGFLFKLPPKDWLEFNRNNTFDTSIPKLPTITKYNKIAELLVLYAKPTYSRFNIRNALSWITNPITTQMPPLLEAHQRTGSLGGDIAKFGGILIAEARDFILPDPFKEVRH